MHEVFCIVTLYRSRYNKIMQEKIEFLSYIFIECMVFNDRIFSEKDFKTLLRTQRLDDQYEYFDDNCEDAIHAFSLSEYNREYILDKDNYWKPKGMSNNPPSYNLSEIIDNLRLDLLVEFSLEDFYSTCCDVVNKVDDYLEFYSLKETIYD